MGGAMGRLASLARSRPLVAFVVLAYGLTWGAILALLAGKGFDLSRIGTGVTVAMIALMLLGPSTAGVGMTALVQGRPGLRDLAGRILRWRVGVGWAAVALGTVPALILVVLAAFGATVSTAYRPGFRAEGPLIGLLAGALEELGWTGFATPRLLERHGPLKSGLLLGLIWACWHLLADYAGNIAVMGRLWPIWFAVFWLVPLVAYRVLMTWVYSRTGSLGLAQLMHASYTGWLYALSPTMTVAEGLWWQGAFAGALCVAVGGVVMVSSTISDPPPVVRLPPSGL